jgi:hypothetical protein
VENSAEWIRSTNDYLQLPIPVGLLVISYPQMKQRLGNGTITANFSSWDHNIFGEVIPAYEGTQMVLICICLIWANWKVYQLIKNDQFRLKIAPVCLCLEICNNIIRLASFSGYMQKLTTRPEYRMHPKIPVCLNSFAFAFNLSSGIFIVFFWMNLISMKIYKKGDILERAFWPSFILVGIVFLVQFFCSLLFGVGILDQAALSIYRQVIFCMCFILAIFYFITAYQVFKYSQKRSGSYDIKKIAFKIVLSGVCYVFIVIFGLWVHSILGKVSPLYYHTIAFLFNTSFSFRSLLQIDVFGTVTKNKNKNKQEVIIFSTPETSNTLTPSQGTQE